MESKISVIIPTFNDSANIAMNLGRISRKLTKFGYNFEIIVVDDGSTDGTFKIINDKGYKGIGLGENFGKGAAFLAGYQISSGDYIVLMDSDLQINIDDLLVFENIMALYDAGAVVGNKRHEYSNVRYSPMRWIVSNVYNLICRYMFGIRLRDTQCGLKIFRRSALDKVMPKILVKRFAFDLELLVAFHENGLRVADAPVFVHKQYGSGSVSLNNIFYTLKDTLAVWWRKKHGWYVVHDQRELDTGE